MKNDEHLVQKAICEYLDIRRVCYFAIPNGGSRKGGAIEGARLKNEGVKSGVPDLFFVWEGMSYFLEVKRPKNGIIPRGRVSKNQTEMMERLTSAGAECAVVYCVADVIEKFIDWGIGH